MYGNDFVEQLNSQTATRASMTWAGCRLMRTIGAKEVRVREGRQSLSPGSVDEQPPTFNAEDARIIVRN
jgi:hypothetical protein